MSLTIEDLGLSASIASIVSDLASGSATFYRNVNTPSNTVFDLPSSALTTVLITPFISYATVSSHEERNKFSSVTSGFVKFTMGTVASQESIQQGDFCTVNFSNGREVVRGSVHSIERESLSSLIKVYINVKAKVPKL